MRVDSPESAERIRRRAFALLDGGQAEAALALAESLDEGVEPARTSLQALILTEAGEALGDAAALERGRDGWRSLDIDRSPHIAYNLANAELGLWGLAKKERRFGEALQRSRSNLLSARQLYERVGADPGADTEVRVQALTNLGNSYDSMGREIDGYRCWSRVTELDPDFGMALGNVGVALAEVASHLNQHAPTARTRAARALDRALLDREGILSCGGPRALKRFEEVRDTLPEAAPGLEPVDRVWSDPYLEWCRRNELFLHLSPGCQAESDQLLDPLYIRQLSGGGGEEDRLRIVNVFDAFNAVKQDFLAARYSTWLASAPESPIRDESQRISAATTFLDSLECGRWGVRTGIATAAFAATTNVLDKIANYIHLYFGTTRKQNGIYFKSLWHPRGKEQVMDPELRAAIEPPRGNRGLLALCDLACELERETPLAALVSRRHTATHRFLVVHSIEPAIEASDPLDRIGWNSLKTELVQLLGITRAAIIYLARAIDIEEARSRRADEEEGEVREPIPMHRVDPRLSEID